MAVCQEDVLCGAGLMMIIERPENLPKFNIFVPLLVQFVEWVNDILAPNATLSKRSPDVFLSLHYWSRHFFLFVSRYLSIIITWSVSRRLQSPRCACQETLTVKITAVMRGRRTRMCCLCLTNAGNICKSVNWILTTVYL